MTHLLAEGLARRILHIVFAERKLLDAEQRLTKYAYEYLEEEELYPHLNKIVSMVKESQPITMVLPAYPGKSPNRNKTLTKMPDLAETHSIDMLYALCEKIGQIYAPGARVLICSDGYVFSDLVRIPDEDVGMYTDAIEQYCHDNYPNYFEFFDIKDAFTDIRCLDAAREELMIVFGESLVHLTKRTQSEKEARSMYTGITKFLYEDFIGLNEFADKSKTQIQKAAKATALRVILRSNAWSALLAQQFPSALRLSIHPQFRKSEKIGVKLANSADCWRTPWHSVAVVNNNQVHLAHRSHIKESLHRLMFNGGVPSHYIINSHLESRVDV